MSKSTCAPQQTFSRRRLLTLGGMAAGAAIIGCNSPTTHFSPGSEGAGKDSDPMRPFGGLASFPARTQRQIESVVDAKGAVNYGVLQIEIDRNDIRDVMLRGTPILPSFEINGDLNFEWMGNGKVMMNSDLCLKRDEIDPFIDQLIRHDTIFQAEHQHFYDFEPIVFFIHFRAYGDALAVARGCKAALNVTSTPFPQAPPKHPHTPLPAQKSAKLSAQNRASVPTA